MNKPSKPVLEATRMIRKTAELLGDLGDPDRLNRRIHNATVERKKAEKKLRQHLRRTDQQ